MIHESLPPALLALVLAATASPAHAGRQEPASPTATAGPPIQRIATASAISTEPLGAVTTVRELPDGRVLVDDAQRRRLLLMDTALKVTEVVLDSMAGAANFYGTNISGGLVPFRGDTTLFIDPSSYAMLVIDPAGKVVRVRSVWRVRDIYSVRQGVGLDAKGRVVYRVEAQPTPPRVAPPAGVPYLPNTPDSAFIVAADIDTRQIDTLGVIRTPKTDYRVYQTPGQTGFSIQMAFNPLPRYDGWAVLSDGTVAFVRALDYRVEYLAADGSLTSSDKLPYEWQRLTSEDKQRLVDSVLTAQRRSAALNQVANLIRWVNLYKKEYPTNFKPPQGFVLPPGLPKDARLPPGVSFPEKYIYACPPGVEPTMVAGPAAGAPAEGPAGGMPVQIAVSPGQGAAAPGQVMVTRGAPGQVMVGAPPGGAPTAAQAGPGALPGAMSVTPSCYPNLMIAGGREPPPPTIREPAVVKPDELPDYRPPLPNNAVRADLDGNLWIRTNPARPTPGGSVYDIVNRDGQLTARLQTPPGYTIVGFGRNKTVYLSMRDAAGVHVARVRLR